MVQQTASNFTLSMPSDTEIVMTREFNAPRKLVFEAHSKPEHLKRWWGLREHTMPVCEMDFRPGGAWHFVSREVDGQEYGFRGEFREIVPPEKIVWTFEFEGMPGHISVETVTFEERDGKTILTASSAYASKEDRDGMASSGMEAGARETWDRLAEYLATMS